MLNKAQKAFTVLRFLTGKVLGEEFGQFHVHNAARVHYPELANELELLNSLEEIDDLEALENSNAGEMRLEILAANPHLSIDSNDDYIEFLQEALTSVMRDIYFHRPPSGFQFGNAFGQIETILYQTVLTKTIFMADEGDETDQLATKLNALKYELEIRT